MLIELGLFVTGLVLLYFGAEAMVAGASGLAFRFGVKPVVIGLTVVAFGTSSPELLVCLTAAIEHTAATDAISIGNILGSNIANIVLILGCASLLRPLAVREQAVRREYPMMLGASFLLAALIVFDGQNPTLSRLDGGILVSGMVAFLVYSYVSAVYYEDKPTAVDDDVASETDHSTTVQSVQIAGGIAGLALGAYWMVESSVSIAKYLGVPEVVIGISIVALGTSLPELATSVVAAFRDEADISVGNVIGSNLFNILLVLGTVSLIAPIGVDARVLEFDLWMMLGVAIGIWPILESGETIRWFEGLLMLAIYVGYITLLFTW